jgi:uncharacterized membrane protein YphA (DoxX/SURF4 family)
LTRSGSVRDPAAAIALLRIAVGLYFAKALVTKLTIGLAGGFVPLPQASARWVAAMPHIVAKQAAANPLLFYQRFLDGVVLPHATLFAHLTACGEAAVGVGLTLGLLTPVAAGLGLFLVTATGWPRNGCRRSSEDFTSCWLQRWSPSSWRGRAGPGGSTVGSVAGEQPDGKKDPAPLVSAGCARAQTAVGFALAGPRQ